MHAVSVPLYVRKIGVCDIQTFSWLTGVCDILAFSWLTGVCDILAFSWLTGVCDIQTFSWLMCVTLAVPSILMAYRGV